MATKKTSKKSALKPIPETTATNRENILREFLAKISMEETPNPPTSVEQSKDLPGYAELLNNYFACGASQFNADLALAAKCECEGDVQADDDTFVDICFSSEYLKLKRTFVETALGHGYALTEVVWRAYNAGRLSPERLYPDSDSIRAERHRRAERLAAK
jgi:hypothetical protein